MYILYIYIYIYNDNNNNNNNNIKNVNNWHGGQLVGRLLDYRPASRASPRKFRVPTNSGPPERGPRVWERLWCAAAPLCWDPPTHVLHAAEWQSESFRSACVQQSVTHCQRISSHPPALGFRIEAFKILGRAQLFNYSFIVNSK